GSARSALRWSRSWWVTRRGSPERIRPTPAPRRLARARTGEPLHMTSAPHETRQVVEMEPVEQTADTVEGETPASIPARGWKDIALRSKDEIKSDNVTLLAAGVAFYALLSLVP